MIETFYWCPYCWETPCACPIIHTIATDHTGPELEQEPPDSIATPESSVISGDDV